MDGLSFLLIILLISTAIIWVGKSAPKSKKPTHVHEEPKINEANQAILDSAKRLVEIINESLTIADQSMNADTKLSRLGVAKQRLLDLKQLCREHPFIRITQLPQVEQKISSLEFDFTQAKYQEAAEGNMRGQAFEKEGSIDEAIIEYERLLEQ